jgi:hypothetical protein
VLIFSTAIYDNWNVWNSSAFRNFNRVQFCQNTNVEKVLNYGTKMRTKKMILAVSRISDWNIFIVNCEAFCCCVVSSLFLASFCTVKTRSGDKRAAKFQFRVTTN